MLRACKHCGHIHDSKYNCGKRPKRKRQGVTDIDKFRRSQEWTDKSISIRERDNYLCQICIRNLYHTVNQFTYNNLSVHHAIPIAIDWEKRLDDDNLITVCSIHHEMMEDGTIPYEIVKQIINDQEMRRYPPG